MNSRKLLVILLVFGLLVGNLTHVPVARATEMITAPPDYYSVSAVSGGVFSYDLWVYKTTNYPYCGGISITQSFLVDGVQYGNRCLQDIYGTHMVQIHGVGLPASLRNGAAHSIVISGSVKGNLGQPSALFDWQWTGTVVIPSGSGGMEGVPTSATWYAPSVSLSGAFTTQIGVPYTCTATASNGTAPYRYLFSIDWVTVIGGVNNYTEVYTGTLSLPTTGSKTFTYTFTFTGEFLIRVTALDAQDYEADDTLDLNAGVNKPALWGQIYDIPDGDADMTYINFKLFPASVSQENPPVANGAIQTQFYEITSPGTVEKGSVYYMLSPVLITALPNPLLVYVNYHDPTSGADWSYVFSFNTTNWAAKSGAASNGDTWTGAETPGAFAWLWNLLVKLFRFLFVPSATDFSKQVAEGWVLITSPVPVITPQYTIPFPNPNHLLAPTGDSVNIDFSVISTWTYYATVKALVQVFLYAILIFVVIGIVT